MKVLFACGGSGGHVIPAISMAQILEDSHVASSFVFVGSEGGIEKRITAKEGYSFRHIPTEGLHRSLTLRNFRTLYLAATSTMRAVAILKDEKPALVIGTGGYVSFPLIRAAKRLSIPCLLYESNTVPGLAVKLTEKAANAILLQFDECKTHLHYPEKATVMGAPLRRGFSFPSRAEARRRLHMNQRDFVFLSFGGSLGAENLNTAMLTVLKDSAENGKVQHIHGFGQLDRSYPEKLKAMGVDLESNPQIRVLEYINNMADCLAAADVVISRCGAITLTEIEALGKASILIPSPNVAENHQYHNGMALVNRGAAELIEEKNLSGEALLEKLTAILSEEGKSDALGAEAKKMSVPDANERIYQVIMEAMEK